MCLLHFNASLSLIVHSILKILATRFSSSWNCSDVPPDSYNEIPQHLKLYLQALFLLLSSGPLPSFDNYTDYEYEDPTPLIRASKTHLEDDMDRSGGAGDYPHYATLENTDMRCASMRRGGGGGYLPPRPRVSSPTQIEHPNLPPLNLYNHHPRKTATLSKNYRNAMEKYGC